MTADALLPLPSRAAALLRAHGGTAALLGGVLALNLFAGFSIMGSDMRDGRASATPTLDLPDAIKGKTPPPPEPLAFRDVDPTDAVSINAAVPIADLPNPPATAFRFRPASSADSQRSINCLTSAIYYEAGAEPIDGQRAVAQVVLNRARHPAFAKSICGVVWEGSQRATGCQFTFTCDGSLMRQPWDLAWNRARSVAEAALAGYVHAPVGWATHYHTNWVVPYWSSSLVKIANVGTHIFYRWTGGWGTASAFRNRPSGREIDVATLGRRSNVAVQMVEDAIDDTDVMAAAAAENGVIVINDVPRAVVRRYEPARAEDAAGVLAKQTRPGDTVSAEVRWALTGEETPPSAAGPSAAPKAPVCLDGVRKTGQTVAC